MLEITAPRAQLAFLPTPIQELSTLSVHLGGPRVFIKRDDCTGLATGGNKTRKLEYLVGDALASGADTLITEGGIQSNFCRQAAAAAANVGLGCVAVLSRGYNNVEHGNLLLDALLGAQIVLVNDEEDRYPAMQSAADGVKANGGVPYLIPLGGSNGVGALGYAGCYLELAQQERELGVSFDIVVTPSESGGTQGGLILGEVFAGDSRPIYGISAGESRESLEALVRQVVVEGALQLDLDVESRIPDIIVLDDYVGEGYGVPTPEMKEAVGLVARTEGILLDPVYSGKAMAGLIDLATSGAFARNENILFIHTGGTPGLFAYAAELMPREGPPE